jgi:signal transduction histidine kinase
MFEVMGRKNERWMLLQERGRKVNEVVFKMDPDWKPASEGLARKISREQRELRDRYLQERGETTQGVEKMFLERLGGVDDEKGDVMRKVWEFCSNSRLRLKQVTESSIEEGERYYEKVRNLNILKEIDELSDKMAGTMELNDLYRLMRDFRHVFSSRTHVLTSVLDEMEENEKMIENSRWQKDLREVVGSVMEAMVENLDDLENILIFQPEMEYGPIFSVWGSMYLLWMDHDPEMSGMRDVQMGSSGIKWWGSFSELHKMMDNLVSNSVKHSKHDDLDYLRIDGWMGVSNKRMFRFVWMDNGVGFSDEMLEMGESGKQRALEEGVTTDGTGVGLWSIDQFVTSQGGEVRLLNGEQMDEPFFGAIVVVDIPIKK